MSQIWTISILYKLISRKGSGLSSYRNRSRPFIILKPIQKYERAWGFAVYQLFFSFFAGGGCWEESQTSDLHRTGLDWLWKAQVEWVQIGVVSLGILPAKKSQKVRIYVNHLHIKLIQLSVGPYGDGLWRTTAAWKRHGLGIMND